jgi:hypothetical protein
MGDDVDSRDDVDSLLAQMGAAMSGGVVASSPAWQQSKVEAVHAHPPGREELKGAASELWNPSVRWSTGTPPPARVPTAPSPHTEVLRQKAVRALHQRFKAMCNTHNTGWDEPTTNQHFERWMLDSKAADSSDADPLLPGGKAAAEGGLRRELFKVGLQRPAVQRFIASMEKGALKAIRTLTRLAAAGGSHKQTVRVGPRLSAQQQPAAALGGSIGKTPMYETGWDGKPMLSVRYGGSTICVNQCHWDKLAQMLRLQLGDRVVADERERALLDTRIFCLLLRYNALQGGGVHGGGFQAAIPSGVFDALLSHFGVCFECFASPLNSRYPRFCSAFADTDAPFGSVGSFFSFQPSEGSFEANPPFVPDLILRMAEHMHKLLLRADGSGGSVCDCTGAALCFVVIIPSWDHTMGWKALLNTPFCRHHLRLAQREHGYTEGAQHCRRRRYRVSVGDTSVFFLQSAAARVKWPVTSEALRDVQEAFSSKHTDDDLRSGGGGGGSAAASAKNHQVAGDHPDRAEQATFSKKRRPDGNPSEPGQHAASQRGKKKKSKTRKHVLK